MKPDLHKHQYRSRDYWGVFLTHAAAFLAFFMLIWFVTSGLGVGTSPDSADYLSVAENLRNHLDYRNYRDEASPHFPPLYSASVAATSVVTLRDVRHGAPRLFAAVSFAVLGVLTYGALRWCTGCDILAGVGCLGILAQPDLVRYGATALTEIPFLALSVAGGISLLLWSKNRRAWVLWVSAACFALACLMRYVGVVWPAVSLLVLLADQNGEQIRTRLQRAAVFLFVAYSPLLLWFAFWAASGVSPGGRTMTSHPVELSRIENGLCTLSGIFGNRQSLLGGAILAALVLIPLAGIAQRLRRDGTRSTGHAGSPKFAVGELVSIFASAYIAFLILSISFIDRATPLDGRILSPVIWAVVFLLVFYVAAFTQRSASLRYTAALCLFLVFLSSFLYRVVPPIAQWYTHGLDLSHDSIRYDQTLGRIRDEDFHDRTIYSNVPWIVYLTTWKDVSILPARVDYTSGRSNARFDTEVEGIIQAVSAGKAIIVMDTAYSDTYFKPPTVFDITQRTRLPYSSHEPGDRFVVFGLSSHKRESGRLDGFARYRTNPDERK